MLLTESFFSMLMSISELELVRGAVEAEPSDDMREKLLRAVPFALGTENITGGWIDNQFKRLAAVFASEISSYDGQVSMYFTEKSQKLHVPERIFFHLVENSEDDFPFAFLATYATKVRGGSIRHMPLQYAMTEFKGEREKLLQLLSCLGIPECEAG